MKSSEESKKVKLNLKGYLLTWVQQSMDADDICIYGNSHGLRSLGEALISIADLTQENLLDSECPQEDSYHHHFTTSMNIDTDEAWNLKRLTIGRVEEKKSGKIRSNFPSKKT
jgi:hypothetical protein